MPSWELSLDVASLSGCILLHLLLQQLAEVSTMISSPEYIIAMVLSEILGNLMVLMQPNTRDSYQIPVHDNGQMV